MGYDSKPDTEKHIMAVRGLLGRFINALRRRFFDHDKSKLEEPEKAIFDEFTPKLKGTTYGSPEYKKFLEQMQVALKHHYAHNRHHPEHHENGIEDMNLIDIVEMFCDWMAAVQRHDDGDIHESIRLNQGRFDYTHELAEIFHNTARLFEENPESDKKGCVTLGGRTMLSIDGLISEMELFINKNPAPAVISFWIEHLRPFKKDLAALDTLQARVEKLETALSKARSDIWQTARVNQGNINGIDPVFPEDAPCRSRIGKHFVHQAGVDQSLRVVSEIDTLLSKRE